MHKQIIIEAGNIRDATKALIMLHGRGSTSEDILSLAHYLNVKDYLLLAPQATNHTWYPFSFLAIPNQNEPWLGSALELVGQTVEKAEKRKIKKENIYFLGFSQGACLVLEYVTRNADRYGGVVAFTGGLIGDKIYSENYSGHFFNTRVFIGSGGPDPHVPVERVNDTAEKMKKMGADVTVEIFNHMGHTINSYEIDIANKTIFQ